MTSPPVSMNNLPLSLQLMNDPMEIINNCNVRKTTTPEWEEDGAMFLTSKAHGNRIFVR